MRILTLLLSFALLASPGYPLDRAAAAAAARKRPVKGLDRGDSRRLSHMQKRDREMDRAMAKRAKANKIR